MPRKSIIALVYIVLLILNFQVYAENSDHPFFGTKNSFISAYRPNYLLPYYHNNGTFDTGNAPYNENPTDAEFKIQLSVKADLWPNILKSNTSLYLAYSQVSFWQEYAKHGYVRETNYEPEMFFSYEFNPALQQKGLLYINVGYDHQSNGRGGDFERSWERAYVDLTFGSQKQNWLFSVKPWIRSSGVLESHDYNSDITKYLGHGRLLLVYKFRNNVFSVMSRNNFESLFKRGAIEANWSFPIYKNIRGFAQFFSGYGQNLSEYKNHANSFGIGLSLSDWL